MVLTSHRYGSAGFDKLGFGKLGFDRLNHRRSAVGGVVVLLLKRAAHPLESVAASFYKFARTPNRVPFLTLFFRAFPQPLKIKHLAKRQKKGSNAVKKGLFFKNQMLIVREL